MNDAPERIELIRASGMVSDYWRSNYSGSGEKDGVEYIRSDIHAAALAREATLWDVAASAREFIASYISIYKCESDSTASHLLAKFDELLDAQP